jgi:hypothetical protein
MRGETVGIFKNIEKTMEEVARSSRERTEHDHGFANVVFHQINRQIAEFEQGLNENEEIGALIAAFGRTVEIRIEKMTYDDPYLLIFSGRTLERNEPVKLVQHVMQINLLLQAVPKADATQKPRRIGFGDASSESGTDTEPTQTQ